MIRLLVGLLAVGALAGCGGDDDDADEKRPRPVQEPRVRTVAGGLEAPWEIAFLPDGRALVTERPGRVRLLSRDGRLQDAPVGVVDVAAIGEGGLLGLAVDPRFEENGFVYLYRTVSSGNEVVRYRFAEDRLVEEAVLVRGIAAAAIHDGGRLRFGPDGFLYFSTGDAAQDSLAQEPGSLNGKILRLAPGAYRGGGGRPEVFTLGHRNPQGFDWRGGRMVATEHGPDGDDEINVLRRGSNYGWPEIRGEATREGVVSPANVYGDSIAPSGATFVRRGGSAWSGDYLFACLVGERLQRVRLDGSRVVEDEALFEGRFGRLRTVVEGPDGALYVLTSNRDGRGSPSSEDDRVLRIEPPG